MSDLATNGAPGSARGGVRTAAAMIDQRQVISPATTHQRLIAAAPAYSAVAPDPATQLQRDASPNLRLFEKSPASPTDVQLLQGDGRAMSSTIFGMVGGSPAGGAIPMVGDLARWSETLQAERAALQERERSLQEERRALQEERRAMQHHMQQQQDALQEERRALQEERRATQHQQDRASQRRDELLLEQVRLLGESRGTPQQEALQAVTNGNVTKAPTNRARRQADPMDDVPALVDAFMSSGHVIPLGVHVAEVEALQQAATRLKVAEESCEAQLKQLTERGKLVAASSQRAALEAKQATLRAERERCQHAHEKLVRQFVIMRDAGINRFMPLLLSTVEKYDATFERSAMIPGGEEALKRVGELCASVTTRGRELRQPLPSALPCTEQATLMMLLNLAIHASTELNQLADDALTGADCAAGCEVLRSPKPVKGIHRCMQKVQEEYEGDYTRLLDLARVTIICDTILELLKVLEWLISDDRAPRFAVCRTKDRLSRSWDAELSGGNRDVMLNGWLSIGGHRQLIVEVQLHVRPLFELKGDLHVLYAGARVLGAMEDLMIAHDGVLDDAVLKRVKEGVLRKLGVAFSPLTASQRDTVKEVLQLEPCALLELDLSNCKVDEKPCFDGLTLPQVLLPPTERLACWRLRSLQLSGCGLTGELAETGKVLLECRMLHELRIGFGSLTGSLPSWLFAKLSLRILYLGGNKLSGPIPPEIGLCGTLVELWLQDNQLSGAIPPEIGRCSSLRRLMLWGNRLSGQIPPELGQCTSLQEELDLRSNQLSGPIPPELGKLTALMELYLHGNQLSGSIPPELGKCAALRTLNLVKNQINGSIPPELGKCAALRTLTLGKNQINGSIPPELGKCAKLEGLYLDGNQLGGSIPPELAKCAALKWLNLTDNQICSYLHGSEVRSIPPELSQCTALTGMWLQKNQLRGALPLELAECKALQTLDVRSNQLTGPVPDLSACSSLKTLALSGNEKLSAADVPPAIAERTDLSMLAAEEALVAQQRAAGGPVVERLHGGIGDVEHDLPTRTLRYTEFSTAGAPNLLVKSGVLYYEVEIVKLPSAPQLGFATGTDKLLEGTGDEKRSCGFDGKRNQIWRNGRPRHEETWPGAWVADDVVGLAANADTGQVAISKNGSWTDEGCGVMLEGEPFKEEGVYPAMTLNDAEKYPGELRYCLAAPFKHGPPSAAVWEADFR